MKAGLTLFLICLCLSGWSKGHVLERLREINAQWHTRGEVPSRLAGVPETDDEAGWIGLHLGLVERSLRGHDVGGLDYRQLSNRLRCLDHLRDYRHAAAFPVNTAYSHRTPIFIDGQDNFCAVGYLIKASGHERLARRIAAENNLAYVEDLHYPELAAWAEEHGFTAAELAWIQPSYSPSGKAAPIGAGVDGFVKDLYADNEEGKLYVGGTFGFVDDSIRSYNIAYLTETAGVYTWHSMGTDRRPVNAITKYKGRIYAGGENGVSVWDGNYMGRFGCLAGTVHALAVMDGRLYATGDLASCFGPKEPIFAYYNDTDWVHVPGLMGRVNTLYAHDTTLILAGNFIYNNTQLNVIKWSKGAGFRPFATGIVNEVNDIELFEDTLYAVCKPTNAIDSLNLIHHLVGDHWLPFSNHFTRRWIAPDGGPISFNTLCVDGNTLMMGGSFYYGGNIWNRNSMCLVAPPSNRGDSLFPVDGPIHKMAVFKKDLIVGGAFEFGWNNTQAFNGLARRKAVPLSVPRAAQGIAFRYYPNPVRPGGELTVSNDFGADRYTVYDCQGRRLAEGRVMPNSTQAISLPILASGMYLLELRGPAGNRAVGRILVE